MKTLTVQTVQFRRDEESSWEIGIIINEDELIIDMDAKPVPPPIWNFRLTTDARVTLTSVPGPPRMEVQI